MNSVEPRRSVSLGTLENCESQRDSALRESAERFRRGAYPIQCFDLRERTSQGLGTCRFTARNCFRAMRRIRLSPSRL